MRDMDQIDWYIPKHETRSKERAVEIMRRMFLLYMPSSNSLHLNTSRSFLVFFYLCCMCACFIFHEFWYHHPSPTSIDYKYINAFFQNIIQNYDMTHLAAPANVARLFEFNLPFKSRSTANLLLIVCGVSFEGAWTIHLEMCLDDWCHVENDC